MDKSENRGFVLVAVLCWSMLLALAAEAILTISQGQAEDVYVAGVMAQLVGAADAGIRLTLLQLISSDSSGTFPLNGTPFEIQFVDIILSMSIQGEGGKVDINGSPALELTQLFKGAGLSAAQAVPETEKVLDWRETNTLKRPDGAKLEDYRLSGLAYGPRQAGFESVGEFRLVLGISDELFARIEPSLSVASQENGIVWSFATPYTRKLMHPTSVVPSSEQLTGENTTLPRRTLGEAFTIVAQAIKGSVRVKRTAVVRVTGNPRHPVFIYSWS